MYCTCYHKINCDPQTSQFLTADFFEYRLFSRFFVWLLPKWCTRNCLGKTSMFHLKLLINFLSLSIVGQIDWHALGKFIGSTSTVLKLSGSPALLHQVDPSDLLRVDIFVPIGSDPPTVVSDKVQCCGVCESRMKVRWSSSPLGLVRLSHRKGELCPTVMFLSGGIYTSRTCPIPLSCPFVQLRKHVGVQGRGRAQWGD